MKEGKQGVVWLHGKGRPLQRVNELKGIEIVAAGKKLQG